MTAADWSLFAVIAFALAGGAWLYVHARHIEPVRVQTTRHEVWSADLPPELDGLTICQITDTHIAGRARPEEAASRAILDVRADLYVFTGDMIYRQRGIPAFFAWLDALGDGVRPAVAVLGNAEHKPFVRLEDVVIGFEARGIPLLLNRSMPFHHRGGVLQIVGVDDPHTGHSDFAKAYAGADPDTWTLLLCHSPDGAADLDGYRADLMLCGHTHGGQYCLPAVGSIATNTSRVRRLVSGWYHGDDLSRRARIAAARTRLYVSRGLGTGGVPGRLLCRPELPVFTLRRG